MSDFAPPQPDAAPPPPERSKRRPLAWLIGGFLVVALAGGGAWAWTALSGGGTQPEDVLPASTVAYGRLDLDPSATQKIQAIRLLRSLPAFREGSGIDSDKVDLREVLVEQMFGNCVDFHKDVTPWLGKRLGFGVVDQDSIVLALQVTDEPKARKGIRQFDDCSKTSHGGLAFLDGYALVTEKRSDASHFAREAATKPLAQAADFTKAMADLGDPGLASIWVSPQRAAAVPGLVSALGNGFGIPRDELAKGLKKGGNFAIAIRADHSRLALHGQSSAKTTFVDDVAGVSIGSLPKSAVAVAGWATPDGALGSSFRAGFERGFRSASNHPTRDELKQFRSTFGFDPSDTTIRLLSASPTLVVGSDGLGRAAAIRGPEDVKKLDVSLRVQGSPTKLAGLLKKLRVFIDEISGIPLNVHATEDGAEISTREHPATGSGLDTTGSYRSLSLPHGRPLAFLYLDFDALRPIIDAWNLDNEDELLDNLAPLRAFGLVMHGRTFDARLSFD